MYPAFFLKLIKKYFFDWYRFLKYSSAPSSIFYLRSNKLLKKKDQLRALVTADYHKIEKALALRDCRPGFGVAIIERLLDNMEEYCQSFGVDQTIDISLSCLSEYQKFNEINNNINKALDEKIEKITNNIVASKEENCGGTKTVTREDILKNGKRDLESFFYSRHSIRDFSNEAVDKESLKKAILMAQRTPSVCNRQSVRTYLYQDKSEVLKVLSLQNGCASFADKVSAVFVVTSNLENFFSTNEINQCWVDGGLFSMSLVYSLHSLGIGSCCLNWCNTRENDEGLRKLTGIPSSDVVIMLIACGKYPDNLKVAKSTRRPVEEVLITKPLVH